MDRLKIEFFHDVICSFCFPMSYNMRRLSEEIENLEIIHKSFALMPDERYFEISFGGREEAKDEILSHWEHANQIDEKKRFNIQGMKDKTFPFPSSMKPLIASKASYLAGGDEMYWHMFDGLQKAFFMDSLDIGNPQVIKDIARTIDGLNFEKWLNYFENGQAREAVLEDLKLVESYGITSAPTLIIEGMYNLVGAVDYESLKNAIINVMEKEDMDIIYKD